MKRKKRCKVARTQGGEVRKMGKEWGPPQSPLKPPQVKAIPPKAPPEKKKKDLPP